MPHITDLKAEAQALFDLLQPLPESVWAQPTLFKLDRQQAIQQAFVGIGFLVIDELVHFVARGRQADEVEVRALDQSRLVGLRPE